MPHTITMKIKLMRSYTSRNGNKVFVYSVTGTKSQLEAYKTAQGENYREAEDGTPLWFTVRCVGETGSLIITTNNKVVPDMSAFDQAASLAAQYGGNFGQELAKLAAQRILGGKQVEEPAAAVTSSPEGLDKV